MRDELARVFPREAVERGIQRRFEEIASVNPNRLALVGEGDRKTYGDLNRVADRVAHAITRRSKTATQRVGLYFGHEPGAIVGILGSIKAGRTYVPLDARFPAQRTRFMLQDSGSTLLLTHSVRAPEVAEWVPDGIDVLCIDELDEDFSEIAGEVRGPPETPAYLLYSSGSTGEPKGVVHSHRSVLHHVWDSAGTYGLDGSDRHALILSHCYAASVSEIFGSLLMGGTLCLYDVQERGVGRLSDWLRGESITVLKLPVALFRLLLETPSVELNLPEIRLVITGGDTLFPDDVRRFRERFPSSCRLVNRLASTEANTIAQWVIDPDTPIEPSILPVGRPAPDKEILILDEQGLPVEPGETGELAVRSRYLAHSYWNREAQSQNAFRPSPGAPDVITYRTGDRARIRRDGLLEYLGRGDSQVKIRGFRVEIGEIKAALRLQNGVRQAEIAVRHDHRGEKFLAAYVVAVPGAGLTAEKVRSGLSRELPEYMIPSAFTFLDELPLTPTGKVDSSALPDPGAHRPPNLDSPGPAAGEAEREMVELWEDVLSVRPIGRTDTFLDLGGNSLRAIELITRINDRFDAELPLTALAEAPTVAQLVDRLGGSRAGSASRSLIPLQAAGHKAPFYCVPPAAQTVLVLSDLARHFDPDRPFYGLQAKGIEEGEEPHERVEDMAADYLIEIQRVQPEGPYHIGGVCFGGIVAFEMARQLRAAGESVATVAILDTLIPPRIPLSRMPPAVLLRRIRELSSKGSLIAELFYRTRRLLGLLPRDAMSPLEIIAEQNRRPVEIEGQVEASERLSRVFRAHGRARRTYQPRPYEGQLSLFWSKGVEEPLDRRREWAAFTTRPLDIHAIPGAHESPAADQKQATFFRGLNAASLAETLTLRLDSNTAESR